MKKTIYIISSLIILLGLSACKGDSTAKSNEDDENTCRYEYEAGASKFEWTAFKTTARKGVAGGFNDIEVHSDVSDDPKAVLESITFSMKTSSVETNDDGRNEKIAKHFFETINTPTIDGRIKSLNEDGKAIVEVKMHGIAFDVEGDYTLVDGVFNYSAVIDVSSWNAMVGIDALNVVCGDLHAGEDGVSKLWSEVELKFTTKLSSDCK
jgi:polyisoprenoid-binding protein YceI